MTQVVLVTAAGRDVRVTARPEAAPWRRGEGHGASLAERVFLRHPRPLLLKPLWLQTSLAVTPRLHLSFRVGASTAPTRLIVERLVERAGRTPQSDRAQPHSLAPSARPLAAAAPVPLVLRRASAPSPLERDVVPPYAASPHRDVAAAPWSPLAHRAQAPLDLDRITDQVVKAIDQRVVAHRERLGRV